MKTIFLKILVGIGLWLTSYAVAHAQCSSNCIDGPTTVFTSKYYDYWASPGGYWNPCCFAGTMPTIYNYDGEHIGFVINGPGSFYLYNSITSDYKFIIELPAPSPPNPPVVYQTQCGSVILTLGQSKPDNVDFFWINQQGAEVGSGDYYTATTSGNYYLQSRSHESDPVYGGNSGALYVAMPTRPVDGTITVNGRSSSDQMQTVYAGCPLNIKSYGGVEEPHYWASTNGGASWNIFADYGPGAGSYDFWYTPTTPGRYRFHLRNRTPVCGFCFEGRDGITCPTYPYVDVDVLPAATAGELVVNLGSPNACVQKNIPVELRGYSGKPYFNIWYQDTDGVLKKWNDYADMGFSFNFPPPQASPVWRFEAWTLDDCGHESPHVMSPPIGVWPTPGPPTNLHIDSLAQVVCQGRDVKMFGTPDLSFRPVLWYRTTSPSEVPMNVADPYGYTAGVQTGTLNSTTTFYATSYQVTNPGDGCESVRVPLQVSVTPKPVNPTITAAANTICFGDRVKITTSGGIGKPTYKWSSNSGNTWNSFGDNQSSATHAPGSVGTYLYKADNSNACGDCTPQTCSPNTISVTVMPRVGCIDRNYIVTNTVIGNNVTDLNAVNTLSIDLVNESVQYFDGLGRPIQNLVKQGSPNKVDIVTPVIYDNMGRETRKFLPIVTGTDGRFKSGVLDANNNYVGTTLYSNGAADNIPDDSRPFQETIFEPSPINRVVKTYGAGDSWKTTNDKPIQPLALVNVDGTGPNQERIINWQLDGSGQPIKSGSNSGFYLTGKLNIKSIKDENGRETREYVDVLGRTILKKVQAVDTPTLNDPNHWAQTYYIYDDRNNLVFVIPPEGVRALAP